MPAFRFQPLNIYAATHSTSLIDEFIDDTTVLDYSRASETFHQQVFVYVHSYMTVFLTESLSQVISMPPQTRSHTRKQNPLELRDDLVDHDAR
jgi:hypothetical protein